MISLKGRQLYTALFIVLLILFAFMVFFQIGNRPLLDYDEAIYAQVARQSLEDHSVATFNWLGNIGLGRPSLWAEKPPLMIWLIESGYLFFGVNELGARVWVGLFAIATVVLSFFAAKNLFRSSAAGLLAMGLYFVSYQYIEAAGTLQFDVPVGFFILLSLYFFYLGTKEPKYYYWFGASLALGMLTKNIVGLMPVLIIGIYSVLTQNFSYLRNKKFWYGILIFLAIVLPWHIIESVKVGKPFWDQYLLYHVLKRYNQPLEGNGGDFWFYWNLIKESRVLFWTSLFGLIVFLGKSLQKNKNYLYVLLSALVVFLFFSTANTKLPAYILILYPILTIIGGAAVNLSLSKLLNQDSIAFKIILILVLGGLCYFGLKFNDYKLLKQKERYRVDSKTVGLFLRTEQPELPIYYSSTIGTKPSIIFYSNRIIYFLSYPSPKPTENFLLISEIDLEYKEAKKILSTPTQAVYEIKSGH